MLRDEGNIGMRKPLIKKKMSTKCFDGNYSLLVEVTKKLVEQRENKPVIFKLLGLTFDYSSGLTATTFR